MGLNKSTLSRQIKQGLIRAHQGKVRLSEVRQDRHDNLDMSRQVRYPAPGDDEASSAFAAAGAKKEEYLAKLRALEYAAKSGRLVDAELVRRRVFELSRSDRDALMNWPARVAPLVAAEFGVDPIELEVCLEKHVRQHLSERRIRLEAATLNREEKMVARRTFIKGASLAVLVASTSRIYVRDGLAQQVPNSSGTEPAKLKAPAGACDCHHHIYDAARFPVRAGSRVVPNARVEDYRLLQRRIGTSRNIVVTPIGFPATLAENLVTLDAIKQAGGNARGVAIINPTISNADLQTLHDGGVRGIRFSSTGGSVPAAIAKEIEPLAKRVADLGWHVQINIEAGPILELEDLWNRLPATLVIDHMGHIRQPQGVEDPAFKYILRLIDKGRTWVKLSITYDSSRDGPPGYADVNKVGQAYVKAAPERMLWGSNWPHPNETNKPDDALLLDQLAQWAPEEAVRNHILVDNPATLYGFPRVG